MIRLIVVLSSLAALGGMWGLGMTFLFEDNALQILASLSGGAVIGGVGMIAAIEMGIID